MMKLGKAIPFPIHIEASANMGYVATLGCATFVFVNEEALLSAIRDYVNNPEGHVKMYMEQFNQEQPVLAMGEALTAERPGTGCV